jgi:hypothetical protein
MMTDISYGDAVFCEVETEFIKYYLENFRHQRDNHHNKHRSSKKGSFTRM